MPSILTLTDRAVVAYLISEGVGSFDNVRPFKFAESKSLPLVIVHSNHALPLAGFEPTWDVNVDIKIRSQASVDEPEGDFINTPSENSDAFADSILAAIYKFGDGEQSGGQLADAITAAMRGAGIEGVVQTGAFTCQAAELISFSQDIDYNHFADAWTEILTLKLTCCSGDVS